MTSTSSEKVFSKYQIFIIVILSFIHFTVILDFMVIAPLGAMLLEIMDLSPAQFGWVVSAYAFSAGISGLLAAGFADRYDRKKFLLFFYSGFILGTFLCGVATNFVFLLIARIVTGIFGGVIASIAMAIVTDIFPLQMRGRVMGFIQMSFAVSQVAGIPFGIYLANAYGWHAPFFFIVALCLVAGATIVRWMEPIDAHLRIQNEHNAFNHLKNTIRQRQYQKAFVTTAMLSIGGFLLMPFSSAFSVNNLGISQHDLPLVFMFTGLSVIIVLPAVGRINDIIGAMKTFTAGTLLAAVMILIYTNLSVTPFWTVVLVNVILFAGIMSRMIPAMATMTAVPELADRGAFMSINSSLQQIAGGIASVFAGFVVVQTVEGPLQNYDLLGYYCVVLMMICIFLMRNVQKIVEEKHKAKQTETPIH
ncbi:MAG: MFS transporter [Ignavibacteriales bacterium]|nr:MFS transporter [Ignavibacteriales bacterium]